MCVGKVSRMGRVSGLVGSFVLFAWAILAACSPALKSFPLPSDVRLVAPDPELPQEISAFSGAWTGTWLEPPWGAIGDTALVVERIEREHAIVVYAWANNRSGRFVGGWDRKKALVGPGPRIEWRVGSRDFAFQMGKDLNSIEGTMKVGSAEKTFIRLYRVPPEASHIVPSAFSSAVLPSLPGVSISTPSADLAPELAAFSGVWEGNWGGDVPSRLIVEWIGGGSARVLYAWAGDKERGFKGGWNRYTATVLPGGGLQWGRDPRFTFRMSKDLTTIEGEREKDGSITVIIMKKVAP